MVSADLVRWIKRKGRRSGTFAWTLRCTSLSALRWIATVTASHANSCSHGLGGLLLGWHLGCRSSSLLNRREDDSPSAPHTLRRGTSASSQRIRQATAPRGSSMRHCRVARRCTPRPMGVWVRGPFSSDLTDAEPECIDLVLIGQPNPAQPMASPTHHGWPAQASSRCATAYCYTYAA